MFLSSLEELHKHNQKSTFIKLIVSTLASVIILSLIQPIWMFDLTVSGKNSNSKNSNNIEKTVNFYIAFFAFIIVSVSIYLMLTT